MRTHALLLSLLLAALPASAKDEVPQGQKDFLKYCASCHGADATGNGPNASQAKTPPSDLTMIAINNGNKFPHGAIRDLIDGRVDKGKNNSAHMKGGMPVWGKVFSEEQGRSVAGQISGEIVVKSRTKQLADYLASIQKEPAIEF